MNYETEGYQHITEIPGKGICAIARMAFTTGLFIGLTPIGYEGRYCYKNYSDAKEALEQWDGTGDPSGPWIKYKGYPDERSNPNNNDEV